MPSLKERRWLLAVLLAALVVPLIGLGHYEFESLEGDVLSISLQPVREILGNNYADQSPLFFLLEHFWVQLFGAGEVAVRLISLLSSVVAVWFCYRLGRLLFGPKVALIAASMLIVTPAFYEHARYARMYALLMAASSAALFFAVRYVEERRAPDLAWFALASLVAIYTHFIGFGTTGLAGLYIAVMTLRLEPRRLPAVILAGAVIVSGALWQLLRLRGAMELAGSKVNRFSLKPELPGFFLEVYGDLFARGIGLGPPYGRVFELALWLVLLGLALFGMVRASRRHALLGVLYLLVAQAALFLVANRADVRSRYFAFMLPLYVPFVVAALDALIEARGRALRRIVGTVLAVALLVLSVASITSQNLQGQAGYVKALAFVQSVYQPGDLLAAHPHWHQPLVQLRTPIPVLPLPDFRALQEYRKKPRRVILIHLGRAKGGPPKIIAWLEEHGQLIESHQSGKVRVVVYSLEPEPSPMPVPIEAEEGNASAAPGIVTRQDLGGRLEQAVVRLPGGEAAVVPATGGGAEGFTPLFQWGAGELEQVGRVVARSDGLPRHGMRAPVPSSGTLEISWPAVVLEDELRGFLGLPDEAFRRGRKGRATLEVKIDGQSVGRVRAGGEPGWRHFRFATPGQAGKRGTVTAVLEGEAGRPYTFALEAVKLAPIEAIAAGMAPVGLVPPERVAQVRAAKAAAEEAREAARREREAADGTADGLEAAPEGGGEEGEGTTGRRSRIIPRLVGAGILADARWDGSKASSRTLPPLPPTPPGSYRLRDHLEEAVVELLAYEGGRELCSSWASTAFYLKGEEYGPRGEGQLQGRWRCGADKWQTVARTRQKAGGELRDGLWIHPRDNRTVQVTFPQVLLGGRLEGYFGLTNLAVEKADFPIYLEVVVGGRLVLRQTLEGDRRGWQPFSIDTAAWRGQPVDLAIRVESDKQRWRHLVLDAMTR